MRFESAVRDERWRRPEVRDECESMENGGGQKAVTKFLKWNLCRIAEELAICRVFGSCRSWSCKCQGYTEKKMQNNSLEIKSSKKLLIKID